MVKNATITTEKAFFHSTAGPSNVDVPHANLMVPDNHAMMYMTQTKVNLMMPLNLNKTLLPLNSNMHHNGDILTLCLMKSLLLLPNKEY